MFHNDNASSKLRRTIRRTALGTGAAGVIVAGLAAGMAPASAAALPTASSPVTITSVGGVKTGTGPIPIRFNTPITIDVSSTLPAGSTMTVFLDGFDPNGNWLGYGQAPDITVNSQGTGQTSFGNYNALGLYRQPAGSPMESIKVFANYTGGSTGVQFPVWVTGTGSAAATVATTSIGSSRRR